MLKSSWLLHWLDHGQQLSAIAVYRYEIDASAGVNAYCAMLIVFPIIGLFMSSTTAFANHAPLESGPEPGADEERVPVPS